VTGAPAAAKGNKQKENPGNGLPGFSHFLEGRLIGFAPSG